MGLFTVNMLFLLVTSFAYADNIYASCFYSGTVEKFDSSGNKTTVASEIDGPLGIVFDSSGNLYVSSLNGGMIEKFDPSGNRSTFATVEWPRGLAFDNSGNLYVSRREQDGIKKIDPSGNISIFSSRGNEGLAFDNSGNLYACSIQYTEIEKINPSGNRTLFYNLAADNSEFPLDFPTGIAFDGNRYLYVSMSVPDGTIQKFDTLLHKRTTFASGLYCPTGLAFDSSGNLYAGVFGEGDNGTILKFDPSGNSSVFATGLYGVYYITAESVPEPASLFLLTLGGLTVLRKKK